MAKTARQLTQERIDLISETQFAHRQSEVRVAAALSASLADSILESERVRGQCTNASASALVTINSANTPVKVDIPTKNGLITELNAEITSSNARVTISTPKTQQLFVTATVVKAGNTSTQYNTYIAKNGSIISGSKGIIRSSNTSDKRQVVNQIMVNGSAGDYFEVFIENADNTQNATIEEFLLIVRS